MCARLALVCWILLLPSCGGGGSSAPPTTETPFSITPDALPGGTRDMAYEVVLTPVSAPAGVRAWRWVSGALPRGVGLSSDACPSWAPFSRGGRIASPDESQLTEVSGIAASQRNPGIAWIHDDGGGLPSLYAIDATGTVRQRYDLSTTNTDWEDLAVGPGPDPTKDYLYIADAGDNGSSRTNVHLLRVEEPMVPAATQAPIAITHTSYFFTYPDGPRDMEALFFDWDTGTPYICQKHDQGGDVYKFPLPLDETRTSANPVTLLAVTSGRAMPATITAGDATRDARRVALRGYFSAHEYRRAPGESFDAMFTRAACPVGITALPQYEALAYTPSGFGLWTTTERTFLASSPLDQSTCTMSGDTLRLHGIPREAGDYQFTIAVTVDGIEATRTLTLTVD